MELPWRFRGASVEFPWEALFWDSAKTIPVQARTTSVLAYKENPNEIVRFFGIEVGSRSTGRRPV